MILKKLILSPIIILLANSLYRLELKISVTPVINNAFYYRPVMGGPGRLFKPVLGTSVNYSIRNERKINFGFGLGYQVSRVEFSE